MLIRRIRIGSCLCVFVTIVVLELFFDSLRTAFESVCRLFIMRAKFMQNESSPLHCASRSSNASGVVMIGGVVMFGGERRRDDRWRCGERERERRRDPERERCTS